MTINLTDVTFDLLVAEQLHDIVPCYYCPNTAHWVIQCGYCAHACFRCSTHRDEWEGRRARFNVVCAKCDSPYPALPAPLPWVAL